MNHKIECRFKGNMTFEAEVDNHIITMDIDRSAGGEGKGSKPKLLLLAGLAGCTGMDVVTILRKMQLEIDDFTISVNGSQREEHPMYYENIHIIYTLKGKNIDIEKVKKAVELSQEKYCSVSAQLKKSAKITYEIYVNENVI